MPGLRIVEETIRAGRLLAILTIACSLETVLIAAVPAEQADERADERAEELWRDASKLTLEGEPGEALEKYRKIVRLYPRTTVAPMAQIQIADLFSDNGEFRNAFDAYQEFINKFPASELFTRSVDGQFAVIQRILTVHRPTTQRRTPAPRDLPTREEAVEMLQTILRNARFAPCSPKVQYELAVTLDREGKNREAIGEFWRFIDNYSDDPMADDAAFQIGFIEYRSARDPNHEQSARLRARYAFDYFLQSFPDSEKVAEARHLLAQLGKWDGESFSRAGRLYEKSGQREAALKSYLDALPLSSGKDEVARLKERIERLQRESR